MTTILETLTDQENETRAILECLRYLHPHAKLAGLDYIASTLMLAIEASNDTLAVVENELAAAHSGVADQMSLPNSPVPQERNLDPERVIAEFQNRLNKVS